MSKIFKNMLNAEIFLDDDQRDGKKKFPVEKAPCVHKADHEPYSLIQPNLEGGPWIAGGAAMRWFVGQPVSQDVDIDIFCRNGLQADKIVERIKSYGRFQVMAKTENAVTMRYYSQDNPDKSWLLQIIYVRHFATLEEVINSFDISVCQLGTDGYSWLFEPDTIKDIKARRLRFTKPLRQDSMKRLLKYWTYGFQPEEGLVEQFQNANLEWKLIDSEAYSNAF